MWTISSPQEMIYLRLPLREQFLLGAVEMDLSGILSLHVELHLRLLSPGEQRWCEE